MYEVIGGNLILKAGLQTGQQASAGSPLTASAQNQGQVDVALLEGQAEIGSFDPADSVDVTVAVPGAVAVIVLAGDVTLTVAGETVTLGAGSSHAFLLADPGTVLGNLPEAVTDLLAAGEIRPGAAFALRAKFEAAAWLVNRGRTAAARLLLRGVLRDLDAFVRGRRMTAAARNALAPVVQTLIDSL